MRQAEPLPAIRRFFIDSAGRNMAHLFLILLIVGTIVTFSVQNETPAMVSFLGWKFEASFAAVAVTAMLAGIVLTQLLAGLRTKREASSRKSLESLNRRHRW
jgi:uncharacterized integral membrane protein